LDKWDSDKTTCPYFARSIGSWWTVVKKEILEQKVLGVLVHGRPNNIFFYIANKSIKGDANLNIHGIYHTLMEMYASRPLPRTIFVQVYRSTVII
jgi:hypothetical protein